MSGQLHALAALPTGNAPSTHWLGVWADPRAGLDGIQKRTFLTLSVLELRLRYH
jgi:hypothetical protein